ncbi:hypothetical protein [Rhodopirellula sp. MGV]|uniref:hypothetical protein n=1 Tax=Rhodopirellula sp. MGV TaxID=2023130 RepID=UPI00117A690B|nr:hypothetical protein [Rhodopirellula sp. MGV]
MFRSLDFTQISTLLTGIGAGVILGGLGCSWMTSSPASGVVTCTGCIAIIVGRCLSTVDPGLAESSEAN